MSSRSGSKNLVFVFLLHVVYNSFLINMENTFVCRFFFFNIRLKKKVGCCAHRPQRPASRQLHLQKGKAATKIGSQAHLHAGFGLGIPASWEGMKSLLCRFQSRAAALLYQDRTSSWWLTNGFSWMPPWGSMSHRAKLQEDDLGHSGRPWCHPGRAERKVCGEGGPISAYILVIQLQTLA